MAGSWEDPGLVVGEAGAGDANSFLGACVDDGASSSSESPISLSSFSPEGLPPLASFPPSIPLRLFELFSPKNTSKNAYESFFPMDSMLLTCARFPILFTPPLLARSAPLKLVILLTPGIVPKLFSEVMLEKCGHEFRVGTVGNMPCEGVFIGCCGWVFDDVEDVCCGCPADDGAETGEDCCIAIFVSAFNRADSVACFTRS
mmetsp:Transcript_21998/g.47574  ORF Transcript_21998/g.47574 Transcript_21998/m.47574 type:complete len:202 (+) Transcript_21998:751-1356(+)